MEEKIINEPENIVPDLDIVKTATGKTFRVDMVAAPANAGYAYIRIVGEKLSRVAAVFEDSAETALIEYGPHTLIGYTSLVYAMNENGAVKLHLRKE